MRRVFEKLRNGKHSQKPDEMYIIYADESGTPSLKKGRHYIILGLAAPLEASGEIIRLGGEILSRLKSLGYADNEIKGSEVYKLLKNKDRNMYIKIIDDIANALNQLGSFAIAIVINKKEFKEKALARLKEHLDSVLAKPSIGYLNVLAVPLVRRKIINLIIENQGDLIVRAQSINELLVRVQKELEHRDSRAIVIFDAEADTLASSAYGIFAEALRRDGLAFVKGGLGRPDRILHVGLSRSSLDYGIQLTDLLVNALYNCIEHGVSEVYKYLSVLLTQKGLAVLPKGVRICE